MRARAPVPNEALEGPAPFRAKQRNGINDRFEFVGILRGCLPSILGARGSVNQGRAGTVNGLGGGDDDDAGVYMWRGAKLTQGPFLWRGLCCAMP